MKRSRGSAWDPATATRTSLLTGGAAGARAIEGAVIIVTLVAGSGDVEDELFTLNTAGKAIWDQPGGRRSLADMVAALTSELEEAEADAENATCSASSPDSSRAARWSPPEAGRGRRRHRAVEAARRAATPLPLAPQQ